MDPARLRATLATLPDLVLGPPASLAQVVAFEERFSIALPPAYRRFVREVADGFGIEGTAVLSSLDAIARDLTDTGVRADRPFAYGDTEAAAILAAVDSARAGGNLFVAAVMALQREGIPDGALTLADNGGNDYSVLVVTGAQTGRMWRTGELDVPESPRLYDPRAADTPLDFDGWLPWWVDCSFGLRLDGSDDGA